jgi:hypothetical protein
MVQKDTESTINDQQVNLLLGMPRCGAGFGTFIRGTYFAQ